jgi:hypothetical protein
MRDHRLRIHRFVVGTALGLVIATGAAACGSSSGTRTQPAGGPNTPTTTVPSSGGVSF